MDAEEASERPTSMQIGGSGGLALQDSSRGGSPLLDLNPLWACGHVVAHHPADSQLP